MQQVEMIWLEDLVPENHNYRKFAKIWSFRFVGLLKSEIIYKKSQKYSFLMPFILI